MWWSEERVGVTRNRSGVGCVEQRMNTTNPAHRYHDPVTALFAAALDGDHYAEHELRDLAVHDDHAADALCALAHSDSANIPGPVCPADIAATDQVIAAVLESVAAAVQRAEPVSS